MMRYSWNVVAGCCCCLLVVLSADAQNSTNVLGFNSLLSAGKDVTGKSPQSRVLVCPSKSAPVPILSLPCHSNRDCAILGTPDICCRGRCLQGVQLLNRNSIQSSQKTGSAAAQTGSTKLLCPSQSTAIPLFSLPCDSTKDCAILGLAALCCRNRCLQGLPPPTRKVNIKHEPILFGLVERLCPLDPIPELSEIKECRSDDDCNPRICCPEKTSSSKGDTKYYCRTAVPDLDKIPAARQIVEPLKTVVSYMQCTPPPPPILDVFPKPCESSFDCFPNLCCQENGRRYCRPPKRSLLAFVADWTQRLGTSDLARKAIERITT